MGYMPKVSINETIKMEGGHSLKTMKLLQKDSLEMVIRTGSG